MPEGDGSLTAEFIELIGEEATFSLVENFAGTRLYIPATVKADQQIAMVIGMTAAAKLASRFAPDVIRIPLARELRVARYREQGFANARIALRLGMTESGVNRIVRRLAETDKVELR